MPDDLLEQALSAAARRLPETPLPDLTAKAAAAGLLDIAYATLDAPVGPLVLAASPHGLVRIAYADAGADAVLEELSAMLSPRILSAPRRLDAARRELEQYFAGRRRTFDLPLDLALARGFGRRVLEAARTIGFGEVSTYGRVAAHAGSPRGARAAGNALGRNPIPIVVPCHRVLHSGGGLGGYTGGLERKRLLLALEHGAEAG